MPLLERHERLLDVKTNPEAAELKEIEEKLGLTSKDKKMFDYIQNTL